MNQFTLGHYLVIPFFPLQAFIREESYSNKTNKLQSSFLLLFSKQWNVRLTCILYYAQFSCFNDNTFKLWLPSVCLLFTVVLWLLSSSKSVYVQLGKAIAQVSPEKHTSRRKSNVVNESIHSFSSSQSSMFTPQRWICIIKSLSF